MKMNRRNLARSLAGLAALALVLVACGGEEAAPPEAEAPMEPEPEETEEPEEEADTSFPHVVDGVLQPLEDGFPDRPITMWNAFDPGHTDDLFNVTVSDIARDYSPVELATQSQPQGPMLQYGLVEFLETQPGYDEGYHNYAVSWFGSSVRPYSVDLLLESEPEDLMPINSMVEAPFVFAVHIDDDRFETLEDVEAYAAENPGELVGVGSSAGSGLHIPILLWAGLAEIEVDFLPTSGGGESAQVLAGGGADFGLLTYEPGRVSNLKVLAVTGEDRVDAEGWEDVPTTTELGYNIPAGSFRGVGTVPGIPDAHAEWLAELFRMVGDDPRFADAMQGFDVVYRGPSEAQELRTNIVDTFVPVMREHGLALR